MTEEQSNYHFFKTLKANPIFTFLIVSMGLLFTLTPPFFLGAGGYWSNYKFILLAVTPLIAGLWFFSTKNTNVILLNRWDACWGILLLIATGSFFWSVNGALVWYFFFGWLMLILWMLLTRWLARDLVLQKHLGTTLMLFFLGISFHVLVIWSAGQLDIAERWNSHFGYNANYVSVYLLGFFPFFLFYPMNSLLGRLLKLIGTVFIGGVLWKAGVKGGTIAFAVLFLYYLWVQLPKRYFWRLLGGGTILGLIGAVCLLFLFPEQSKSLYKVVVVEAALSSSHRYYMFRSSLNMFLENPLLGVGTENWYIHAYQEDLSQVLGFDHCCYYNRLGTHNLYEKLATEWGILGLLAFLLPIFSIFWRYLAKGIAMNFLEKGALGTLMIYCIVSIFYRDVNFYELHFSNFQLLAFCSIGMLTATNFKQIKLNFSLVGFIICSLLGVVWFTYYLKVDNKYELANTYFYSYVLPDYELLDDYRGPIYFDNPIRKEENLEKAIKLLEDIYHPIFKTTHGYYGDRRGGQKLLALALAHLYEKIEAYDEAEAYYKLGLQHNPNEENLLRSYARFLIRYRSEPKKARHYAEHAYAIQHNNFYSNILLGEIALREKDYKVAREYLEFVEKHSMDYGFKDIAFLLLTELAVAEGMTDRAAEYLNMVNSSYFLKQKEKVQILIDQPIN